MAQDKILFTDKGNFFTYHNGALSPSSDRERKKLFRTATVPLSLLEIHILKLPDTLSREEQEIQIEIRMYEEGNLDPNEEYTIASLPLPLSEEHSTLFQVFALSRTKAADYFAAPLSTLPAIDLIVPEVVVYESLYNTDFIQGNDLFLYLSEEEAYGVLYQNGRLIAYRSLESLSVMAQECGIDLSTLTAYLSQRGVLDERYPPEESGICSSIQKLLSRNTERLVHMINHKRGLFGFSEINTLYLDFGGEGIPGIQTLFDAYGVSDAVVSPLAKEDASPETFHLRLCAQYLLDHADNPPLNLSPFAAQEAWYRRKSGQLLGLSSGSLLLSLLVPALLSWSISNEREVQNALLKQLEETKSQSAELSKALEEKNALLSGHRSEKESLQNDIAMIEGSKNVSEQIAQMQYERRQILLDTTAVLGKYGLGTLMVEQNGSKQITLQVVCDSQKRDDIAKMMNDLYTRGYGNVENREIKLDETTYNAVIEVSR